MEEKRYRCPNHDIKYRKSKHFTEHFENECEKWLKGRNICTYLNKNGRACGEEFKETASLILHYFKIHDLYACTCCYETFKTAKELEGHGHSPNLNVRLSE